MEMLQISQKQDFDEFNPLSKVSIEGFPLRIGTDCKKSRKNCIDSLIMLSQQCKTTTAYSLIMLLTTVQKQPK